MVLFYEEHKTSVAYWNKNRQCWTSQNGSLFISFMQRLPV